jgi:DNA-binding protein HU-beta
MNKAAIIDMLMKDKEVRFESKAQAERALNAVLGGIKKGLKKDKTVQLIGFGTFSVKHRKARKGRNPQTGAEIKIKASKTVGFKPGKDFKKYV